MAWADVAILQFWVEFVASALSNMKPASVVTTVTMASASATPTAAASALNITYFNGHSGDSIAPSPLPPPGSSSDVDTIVSQFSELTRSTTWNLVAEIPFEGDTWEPEGIARIGPDRYVVSAGEYVEKPVKYSSGYINGTDRTAGVGFGHLIVFDGDGKRVADATLTADGDTEYHNGGIDYDGTYIWATLSEYRPNSTATLVRVDPSTLVAKPILRIKDHSGGAVHDTIKKDRLLTLNWGSREAALWDLDCEPNPLPDFTAPKATAANPSYWIDYQDCKFLGHPQKYDGRAVMMCSGIADVGSDDDDRLQAKVRVGGVAIVDMLTMVPLAQVPIPMVTEDGTAMAKNPFDVAVVDGKMRFYFLPHEEESSLYVYEAE